MNPELSWSYIRITASKREEKEEAMRLKGTLAPTEIIPFLELWGDCNYIDSDGNRWLMFPGWFMENEKGFIAVWPQNLPSRLKKLDLKRRKEYWLWSKFTKSLRFLLGKKINRRFKYL